MSGLLTASPRKGLPTAMTSSLTPITAASNGDDTITRTERKRPEHGLAVLRQTETRSLIHLGMDALGEAHTVGHDLHQLLYGDADTPAYRRQELLVETLTCMETAEHYLLMLGDVLGDYPARNGPPLAAPD